MDESTRTEVIKGHGTGNDFILIPDPEAAVDLTAGLVRSLADRHRGIGADGVIRLATAGVLVRRGVLEGLPEDVRDDDWFMDYRNADGSVAEMCGNGVRVFAHALSALSLTDPGQFNDDGTLRVGTRAGRRDVRIHSVTDTDAEVSVDMGVPVITGTSAATLDGVRYEGVGVDMGNPHLACVVPGLSAAGLADLRVDRAPDYDTGVFPTGVNLELVTALRDGGVHMRVHERGVGETLSCGTGTVAAAVAALVDRFDGAAGTPQTWEETVRVVVPGGEVAVTVGADGEGRPTAATLRGPSKLVFTTEVTTGTTATEA
ncbi:diaminopimelate epimerase [Corynebacterium sp.]|uniref:diaminopimelate epimerase n=1 Tax=Corynebacterium sp. TaxID=1720 RepID=UPI0025C54987|nr:diaminopimelate epimerase [Corynebacterium sp.]